MWQKIQDGTLFDKVVIACSCAFICVVYVAIFAQGLMKLGVGR